MSAPLRAGAFTFYKRDKARLGIKSVSKTQNRDRLCALCCAELDDRHVSIAYPSRLRRDSDPFRVMLCGERCKSIIDAVTGKGLDRIRAAGCAICGKKKERCEHCNCVKTEIHVDHIVEISQGGWSIPENMQPLCRDCHFHGKPGRFTRWWSESETATMRRIFDCCGKAKP